MRDSTAIFASNNEGKVREIQSLLGRDCTLKTLRDFHLDSPDETGLTFVENALIKARFAAMHTGLPAFADDSGLVVPALLGAPGLWSSRYAGEHANDDQNIDKLLAEMINRVDRQAYFMCVMVYLRYPQDPDPLISSGRWWGEIAHARTGAHGFGYDPIFLVPSLGMTAAQCTPEEKNRLSHRAQALRALQSQLLSNGCA